MPVLSSRKDKGLVQTRAVVEWAKKDMRESTLDTPREKARAKIVHTRLRLITSSHEESLGNLDRVERLSTGKMFGVDNEVDSRER